MFQEVKTDTKQKSHLTEKEGQRMTLNSISAKIADIRIIEGVRAKRKKKSTKNSTPFAIMFPTSKNDSSTNLLI